MSDLNYEIPDFDPVESKRKYDLEIKKEGNNILFRYLRKIETRY